MELTKKELKKKKQTRVKRSDIFVKVVADKATKCGNIFSEQVLEAIHKNNKSVTKYDTATKTLTIGKKAMFLLIYGVAAVEQYENFENGKDISC